MLLRRLSKHVEDQNWFAVTVDFLIVVGGVFIGLQVANWNEVSKAKAQEAIVIEQLYAEFTDAVTDLREIKITNDLILESTREVLRVIRDDVQPKDDAAFLRTLLQAGSSVVGPKDPVTLTELLASGRLSNLSSPGLRTALINYRQINDAHQELGDLLLLRISTPHDGFHTAIHVNSDYDSSGNNFLERYDWDQLIDAREQFQVILYAKLGLSQQIAELIKLGEVVLAELEAAKA
jgi:hypothetical protein